MREERITADRLTAFSDAVFAVIVTVIVLELKAPINRNSRLSGLCGPRRLAMRRATCSSPLSGAGDLR